ncbi:MAG TPA: hypothetical protein VMW67_05510 [Desulfobacteria bacterium]|nr:hypothetical protein [Desulfobacteria bacterium]
MLILIVILTWTRSFAELASFPSINDDSASDEDYRLPEKKPVKYTNGDGTVLCRGWEGGIKP